MRLGAKTSLRGLLLGVAALLIVVRNVYGASSPIQTCPFQRLDGVNDLFREVDLSTCGGNDTPPPEGTQMVEAVAESTLLTASTLKVVAATARVGSLESWVVIYSEKSDQETTATTEPSPTGSGDDEYDLAFD